MEYLFTFLSRIGRKGTIVFILTYILLSIICIQLAGAQWSWVHPAPTGQPLRWSKMWDRNTWYIAGNQGTFLKTTNGGVNWFLNTNAGAVIAPWSGPGDVERCYFFNMNTGICAGTYFLTRTTNAGLSFDSIPGTYTPNIWTSVYFVNNQTGFAVSFNGRMLKSTDGGTSWSFINAFPSIPCYDVYSPDGMLILACGFAGNVIRSADGGNMWSIINTGSLSLYKMAFSDLNTGFVCGSSGTVKLTTNGGLNWADANSGLPLSPFIDIDIRAACVYLTGSPDYIYRSTNLGSSWDTIGFKSPTQPGTDFYLFTDFMSSDTFLTVGIEGLINSAAGSVRTCHTYFVRTGTVGTYMNAVFSAGKNVWTAGSPSPAGNNQIIFSSDAGSSWAVQHTQTGSTLNTIVMLNTSTGYAAGTGGAVIKTTNGGLNWVSLNFPPSNTVNRIDFVNTSTGWAFGSSEITGSGIIYKTTDGGSLWTQQNSGFSNPIRGGDMVNALTGWYTGLGRVAKTTDGGSSWIAQVPPSIFALLDIKMLDVNTGYTGGYQTIAKTTDGGNNWATLSVPLPAFQVQSLDFADAQNGILTVNFNHSLRTSDGGSSWTIETMPGASGNNNKIFMADPNTAYNAGFGAGVFKYNSGLMGSTHRHNVVPEKFELEQNYPNPFNPSTVIEFSLAEQAVVSLKVYDASGREVRAVFDNISLNRGMYRHYFDGSQLASGVYFYSLCINGTLFDTKRMVILK